jgi:hypothetical protein
VTPATLASDPRARVAPGAGSETNETLRYLNAGGEAWHVGRGGGATDDGSRRPWQLASEQRLTDE